MRAFSEHSEWEPPSIWNQTPAVKTLIVTPMVMTKSVKVSNNSSGNNNSNSTSKRNSTYSNENEKKNDDNNNDNNNC